MAFKCPHVSAFRVKKCKCLTTSRTYTQVWNITQPKNAKRRKIEQSTKWRSWICGIFRFSTPKIQTGDFSKINTNKSNILSLSKNVRYGTKMHQNNIHTKLQSNIFISSCSVIKTDKGNYVTSLECSFDISICHTWKWRFWNPETKLDKIAMFSYKLFEFENSTKFDLVWPNIDISSGQV